MFAHTILLQGNFSLVTQTEEASRFQIERSRLANCIDWRSMETETSILRQILDSRFFGASELARVFREQRLSLAEALFQAARETDSKSGELPPELAQLEEWARAHFLQAIDIASEWLKNSNQLWEDLFSGWIHSALMAPLSDRGTENGYRPSKMLEYAKAHWTCVLGSRISTAALRTLAQRLDRVIGILSEYPRENLRVLFI